jgi:hypothetical protein
MGVMPCHRTNCENILCHTRLHGHYICASCLNDFDKYKKTWPSEMTRSQILEKIEAFFASGENSWDTIEGDEIEKYLKELVE